MTAHPAGRDSAPPTGRRRLTYFHGQLLSAQDLRQEQGQFLARLRLHNLALHGYGVAYGLWTRPVPPPRGCPDPERAQPWIEVSDGVAVDRHGDELTVPCGVLPRHNLWRMLDEDDRGRALDEIRSGRDVIAYLTIHHCEEPVDSVRAVYSEACDSLPRTAYARIREGFVLRATLRPPRADPCDIRCPDEATTDDAADAYGCGDGTVVGPGLLLARVDGLRPDWALKPEQVHPEVRRPLARRPSTVITGLSWQHGERMTTEQARTLLGDDGLEIRFSRPVRTATLRDPGIADLFQFTGGRGAHGTVMHLETEVVTPKPADETTDRVTIRQTDHEYLNDGDRIHLVLRTPFVLDVCGDPVDGTHTGGLVPGPDGPVAHRSGLLPPDGAGPRTSGTPAGAAGTFESWIVIAN